MVNLHFSLLPRWRGAAPVERAILAGDDRDGRLPHEGGGGARHRSGLRRRAVPIGDDIDLPRCAPSWSTVGSALLVESLAGGVAGLPVPVPQRGEPTIAPKLTPEDLRLDWDEPAAQLHRVVRLGRAWTTFRGAGWGARGHAGRSPAGAPRPGPPGTLVGTVGGTGTGTLELERCSRRAGLPWRPTTGPGVCGLGRRASRQRLDMSAVTVTPIEGWNPDQYERFHAERRQPFDDLVALCHPVPGGRVVDLGCGTGNLTVELHERMQAAETVGVDSSESMLARAKADHGDVPGCRSLPATSRRGSARGSTSSSPTRRCSGSTTTSTCWPACAPPSPTAGQLAFQVPANFRHPSHLLARQVANESPFIDALDDDVPEDRGRFVLSPEIYADLLYELGAKEQVVRMEVYGHELSSTVRGRRVGDGNTAHAVPHPAQSRALRRLRRALPGTPARRAG
jgi:trans-aconitate 2-methyltransferase